MMFAILQRLFHATPATSSDRPPARPQRDVTIEAAIRSLLAHWSATGSFVGAMADDLPKMHTDDGIEVICCPDQMMGITAAQTAFGIEIAHISLQDLAQLANVALAPLPHPDWTPDLVHEHAIMALTTLSDGQALRLTCTECAVDPCFNHHRHPGARLIGHILRD